MLDEISDLRGEARERLDALNNLNELQRWRSAYLGRGGAIPLLLRRIGELPHEQRPAAGREANALKRSLESAYEARHRALANCERTHTQHDTRLDVSLPGRAPSLGRLHPVTRTLPPLVLNG